RRLRGTDGRAAENGGGHRGPDGGTMSMDFDLLIIGGGLVGGSLALALQATPLRIGLVEALSDAERRVSPAGDRALALSRSTAQSLAGLGLWDAVAARAMPIRHIHVSDRGHFGKTRLH